MTPRAMLCCAVLLAAGCVDPNDSSGPADAEVDANPVQAALGLDAYCEQVARCEPTACSPAFRAAHEACDPRGDLDAHLLCVFSRSCLELPEACDETRAVALEAAAMAGCSGWAPPL